MRYVCAISCCGADFPIAEAIHSALRERNGGAFLYRTEDMGAGHLIDQHHKIYERAMSRLYLLRRESFVKTYPALELNCGARSHPNVVLPIEEGLRRNAPPDGFHFIHGEGWSWLPLGMGAREVAQQVIKAVRR